MKTLKTMMVVAAVLGLTSGLALAQTKVIQGEAMTVTVTIEAIEQSTRTLTVKDDKGIYETLQVGPEIKRFSELKVGDKITARYYENVVIRLKKPNEPAVDLDTG